MTTDLAKIHQQIDEALSKLTSVDRRLTAVNNEVQVAVKAITDEYKDEVDQLTASRNQLVDQISRQFAQHRDELLDNGMKSLTTRSGTLSAKFGSSAIDINNESAAMAYTRRKGMLTRVTSVGKRTFVKASLKKFPEFVAKCPGMVLRRTEFLQINLVETQVEINQDLEPYRRKLS